MLKYICLLMILMLRPYGARSNNASTGGSVANANDAKLSIIKFTQSIWTAPKGLAWKKIAPIIAKVTATMFTVNWNWMNFCTDSYTFRPNLIAVMMLEKFSSIRIMSHPSCATCVPVMPMAKPTFARFRAGASLVPSPVTATTCASG